jgi:selenocysteine-specific elongation factor
LHVIGTAGHVDHGKSALVERLTGMDPDRFAEEKARGLTIDLGFAWLTLPSGNEIGLIDVPGHERFVKNMLAGAGGITICLFVVAANEGWKPQSGEHLAIVDTLGISSGVIVLTKSDLVEDLDAVRASVAAHVAGTSLASFPVVACSSVTGDGLDELVAELDRVVSRTAPAVDVGRPRLWVDRVFTIAGAGTVVTGTLAGGSLSAGASVEIAPEGRVTRVRTIQSHKKEVASIAPGNRVALNLAGLERQGAERGNAIVLPGSFRTTRLIDVELSATSVDQMGRAAGITEKGAHLLYVGSAEVPVRVKLIGSDAIEPGGSGFAQLRLQDPLPLQRDDRFVLRDAGRVVTLGGGRVLDPLPEPARRGDGGRAALLATLARSSSSDAFLALVESAGQLPRAEALFRTGLSAVPSGVVESGDTLLSRAEAARREAESQARTDEMGAGARAVLEKVEAGGFTPRLTKELDSDPVVVRNLAAAGELVRIGDFHLTAAGAAEARRIVRAHITDNGPVTVAEIRDLLGTTRKYAVPLSEWLDATGATRRDGDLRALGPTP